MTYKWFGALLIIAGCSSVGFSLAAGYRQQERQLQQLVQTLRNMENELQYRLTPLPELCRQAGNAVGGALRDTFLNLARELDWQGASDVRSCMAEAIRKSRNIPEYLKLYLMRMGQTLGQFDLPGQLQELQALRGECEKDLLVLQKDKALRLRSYQTLGLCAGAALAILFA